MSPALLWLAFAAAAPAGEEAAPPAGANVFLYRDFAPYLPPAIISIDLVEVARLGENRWTALELAPGPHIVRIAWPRHTRLAGNEEVLTIAPGRIYTFELRAYGGLPQSLFVRGDPERMRACCRYRPATPRR